MANILVVDDNATHREFLTAVLKHGGYCVGEAQEGEKALSLIQAERFDLVIVNVQMLDMDGVEFVLRVRSDPDFKHGLPRVVFWTDTYLEPEASLLANSCGVSHFINKPVEPHTLLAILQMALNEAALEPFSSSSEHRSLADKHVKLVRNKLCRQIALLEESVELRTAELRKANTELRTANRLKEDTYVQLLQLEKMASIGVLAAGIAREINGPLGTAITTLNSLHDYVRNVVAVAGAYERNDDVLKEYPERMETLLAVKQEANWEGIIKADIASLITESAEGLGRVRKIADDLKSFSHIPDANWQRVDLAEELECTLTLVESEFKHKATVVRAYGVTPPVECLPLEINQVILNLLINAGQAIAENGEVTIGTGREGDAVWIEVADTGSGIPSEILNRIFDPFFTTRPLGKGTGLGLAIASTIVRKHCGKIEVSSEPAEGSRFRVWLPISHPVPRAVVDEVGH